MDFSQKKLPKEAADKLRSVPIEDLILHRVLFSPIYLYLKANEKFLAIKAPLDFLDQKDLEKIRASGFAFCSPIVDEIDPWEIAGRRIRVILSQAPGDLGLTPPPYAVTAAVSEVLGPLWNVVGDLVEGDARVQPFFIAAFAQAVCEAPEENILRDCREVSQVALEHGVFIAAWSVFILLHLGATNLQYLEETWNAVIKKVALSEGDLVEELRVLLGGAATVVLKTLPAELQDCLRPVSALAFSEISEVEGQRVASKVKKILPQANKSQELYELIRDGEVDFGVS